MHLTKITISPVNILQMVHFYNTVFNTKLEPFKAIGTTFYSGKLAGLDLLFCPNDVLDIKAEKNRQQLTFEVENLDRFVKQVETNGGTLLDEIQKGPKGRVCGISDPDGNSIELVEKPL